MNRVEAAQADDLGVSILTPPEGEVPRPESEVDWRG